MQNILLPLLTIVFYGIATGWQAVSLQKSSPKQSYAVWIFGCTAIILHTLLLYRGIDVHAGQNLTSFNLVSLVAWLVALLVLIGMLTKPISNLILFIYPIAILSIICIQLFPAVYIINTAASPKTLFHILLSTLAFSVLCIAALQAVMLNLQEYSLRNSSKGKFFQLLPPLELMENLLFQMIVIGFILLSMVVVTSVISFHYGLTLIFWAKLFISILAWIIFAALIVGHFFFGWRGKQLIRWTLSGVIIITITFFWSEIL